VPGRQFIDVPVVPGADDRIEDANLQWPPSMTTNPGEQPPLIYGRVYIPGRTGAGNLPELIVEAGVGSTSTDMAWNAAAYNVAYGEYSEYMAQFVPTNVPGEYWYVFRYVYHGTNIVYGLLDGMHTTIDETQAGTWTVLPEPGLLFPLILLIVYLLNQSKEQPQTNE